MRLERVAFCIASHHGPQVPCHLLSLPAAGILPPHTPRPYAACSSVLCLHAHMSQGIVYTAVPWISMWPWYYVLSHSQAASCMWCHGDCRQNRRQLLQPVGGQAAEQAVPSCACLPNRAASVSQPQLRLLSLSHLRTVAEQISSSKTASTAAAILDLRAPLRMPLPAVAPRLSVLSGSSAVRLPVDRHCRSILAKSDSMGPPGGACACPPCSKRLLV